MHDRANNVINTPPPTHPPPLTHPPPQDICSRAMHEQANNVISTPPPPPQPTIIFILTLMMMMMMMMMMITAEMFTKHPKATQGKLTKFMNHHLNDTHEAQGVRRIHCKYHASCADVFEISSASAVLHVRFPARRHKQLCPSFVLTMDPWSSCGLEHRGTRSCRRRGLEWRRPPPMARLRLSCGSSKRRQGSWRRRWWQHLRR